MNNTTTPPEHEPMKRQGRGRTSMRKKLFLLLAAVFVPILLVQTYTYYERFETRRKEEFEANLEVARAVSETVGLFVRDVLHNEAAIGAALTISELRGHQIHRLLEVNQAEYPAVSYIHLISPEGRIRASTASGAVGSDRSDRTYFRAIIAGRPWVVTELYISRVTGQPVFAIARGIRDRNWVFRGIVVAAVDPDGLEKVIAVKRTGGGAITVFDGKGRGVCQSPGVDWTWGNRYLLRRYPVFGETLKGKEVPSVIAQGLDGRKRMFAVAPVASIGWGIAASRPEKEALEPIISRLAYHAGLFLLVAGGSFLAAFIIAGGIANAVQKLREEVRHFAAGRAPQPIRLGGSAELEDLSDTFVQMAREIHERGESLRKSEERFRTSVENLLDGFGIFSSVRDANGKIVDFRFEYINKAGCLLNEKTFEEQMGRTLLELLPAHKEMGLFEEYTRVVESGQPFVREPLIYEDLYGGSRRLQRAFDVRAAKLGDGFVATWRDITERVQEDQEIELLRRQNELILNSAAEGIFGLDNHGRHTFVNPAAARMLGYEVSELVGQPSHAVWHHTRMDGILYPENECPIYAAYKDGAVHRVTEDVFWKKNGESFQVEYTSSPIIENGKLAGAVVAFQDITERKRIEAELFKAQKLESIGLLAGGIAHDFNNLLTAVLGNIGLAKLTPDLNPRVTEKLEDAETATLRAKRLTSQLLTFAKGGLPVKKLVSMAALLEDSAVFALRGSAIRPEFLFPKDLSLVEADEDQIAHVFHNLAINAKEAMPEGGVVTIRGLNVTVDATSRLPLREGSYVQLSVEDHGAGIPEEHIARIFDPYFTTKQEGRGLGLSIVHSIVKKHGGHIEVVSQVGVGATFHVYLPASAKPSPVPEERGEAYKGKEAAPSGKRSVLLMDDEEVVRSVVGEMLEYLGYAVDVAGDGAEAVGQYKKAKEAGQPFDAVILDLTIPGGLGGKETIKDLLAIDSGVRAIVSSGYANDPIMSDFREYGFHAVATKPYTLETLAGILKRVLEGDTAS